ncbi:UDP-glucuronosyl/UDP-glucosyltransferase [Dillenia turbinata]|uniref:UDP-glucuronosyl/UDP-glucosyltransferase n=1 Tax=Dillenia turbinata TaxID=194707 RepID=A0AAN8Z1S6_9MAGN
MAGDSEPLHIAMLPWAAFGHMIPYLELANLIAQKGHKISFLSTNLNIKRLPKPPASLHIEFISLSLPQVEGLPENAEATTDIPMNKVDYLKMAYDGLKEPVAHFLETSKPDLILHDYFSYWVSPIASKLGTKVAFFSVYTPEAITYFSPPRDGTDDRTLLEHFLVPPKWVPFPTNVSFRPCELKRMSECVPGEVGGVSETFRIAQSIRRCDALAIRGCRLFQPEWLKLLEDMHKKPVIPVGQIPPTLTSLLTDAEKESEVREMENWLEKHNKGSVVYVAFGSEAKLTQLEINEIAHGLEKSGLPFFWVLRKRRGPHDDEVLELPEGFEERVRGRGVVYTTWVPQLRILSHDSVGGYLIHSGWSSVVEAMSLAKPMILLTFCYDQGLCARVLEEKKMGYPIPRNEFDGTFTSDSVAESLRLVVVEEGGKIYRDKAREMKEFFGNLKLQDQYVDDLIGFFKTRRHSNPVADCE